MTVSLVKKHPFEFNGYRMVRWRSIGRAPNPLHIINIKIIYYIHIKYGLCIYYNFIYIVHISTPPHYMGNSVYTYTILWLNDRNFLIRIMYKYIICATIGFRVYAKTPTYILYAKIEVARFLLPNSHYICT